jgi:hypothetical protein
LNGKRRWYFGKFFLGFFQQINLETIHWLLQTYLFPAVHQIQLHLWGNISTSITYTTEGWFTDSQTIIINAIPANGDKSNFLHIRWKFAPNEYIP